MQDVAVVRAARVAAEQHDVISVPQAGRRAVATGGRSAGAARHLGSVAPRRVLDAARCTSAVLTRLVAARLLAGCLAEPCGVVVAGSAARLWGLDENLVAWTPELVLPLTARRPQPVGVRYRWLQLSADETTRRAGMPVTTVDRTLYDLARRLSFEPMLTIADAAVRRGLVDHARLNHVARRVPLAWGTALLAADGRAESAFESRVRAELILAGLPPPVLQHVIRDAEGRFLGRVDFAWPEHGLIVEADGASVHASAQALRDDVRRQNGLIAAGWTVLRFTWADLGLIAARVRTSLGACSIATARRCPV